jgi:hypothetical protein
MIESNVAGAFVVTTSSRLRRFNWLIAPDQVRLHGKSISDCIIRVIIITLHHRGLLVHSEHPSAQVLHENPETLRSAAVAAAIRSAISGERAQRPDMRLRPARPPTPPSRADQLGAIIHDDPFSNRTAGPHVGTCEPTRIYRALALLGGATGPRSRSGWSEVGEQVRFAIFAVDMSARPIRAVFPDRGGAALSEPA